MTSVTRVAGALARWRDPIATVVLVAGLVASALGWRP